MENLIDLVIYDWEGERMAKFPMEHSSFEIIEGKLHINYLDELHVYDLERFSYSFEGR